MQEALYVRLEGVNLTNFIEDVHDLSTIRGGSFLLLDAVERVRLKFGLTPITTGASSGFFVTERTADPETLLAEIEKFVRIDDPELKHATIVVDVYKTDKDFLHAREALTAMNRWRQFQQPSVAVPARPVDPVNTECDLDHRRPGAETAYVGEAPKTVSLSVKARRDYGRREKQKFYLRELDALPSDPRLEALRAYLRQSHFANELAEITDDRSQHSLDGKMAVVYFDGNGFGSIQRGCDSRKSQTEFDDTLKTLRRTALLALLESVMADPKGWIAPGKPHPRIRLETLLWGGDELIWVVPAWKGWEVVRMFFDVSRAWSFDEQPLTHSAGVVFCHRAAPIHRMTHIAKALAETCKSLIKSAKLPAAHDGSDLFAYQVLESFDHIGTNLDAFRQTRVPKGRDASELIVPAAAIRGCDADFAAVRKRFPRSKLHDIVLRLRDGADAQTLIDDTIHELDEPTGDALRRLLAAFAAAPTAWFHIAELWDYAVVATGKD